MNPLVNEMSRSFTTHYFLLIFLLFIGIIIAALLALNDLFQVDFNLLIGLLFVYVILFSVYGFMVVNSASNRLKTDGKHGFWTFVANNINDPMFTTDPNYIITNWNIGAENLLGFKEDEAIGISVDNLLRTIYPAQTREEVIAAFEKNGTWKGELIYHTKTGNAISVLVSVFTLFSKESIARGTVVIVHDITVHKLHESVLFKLNSQLEININDTTRENLEEEFHYKSILDNMQEAVMLVDFNYRYLYVNDAMITAGKLPKEAFLNRTIMENYPGIEQTEPFKLIKSCLEDRITARKEVAYTYPDGSVGWGEIGVAPVKQGALFTSVVITDRKLAEKAQFELHARLKAIFEKTNDAIMLADDKGKYVQVNPAATKMLGYSEEELINMNVFDIISGNEADYLWNSFLEDGSQTGVIELVKKDGGLVICHYNATTNILPGLNLSILTDVTERKKAENALIESEKKYRLLFHNNPLPMWMLDLPSYDIVDVNEAAIKHYGYSHAEFISMNARDLRPEDDIEIFEKQIMPSERSGVHYSGKWRHRKKDGTIVIAEIASHDVNLNNQAKRIILANDITEREKALAELSKSEARLSEAQSVAKLGNWETDLKTFEVTWSRETYSIFDLDPDQFQPSHFNFLEYVHPDDRTKVDQAFIDSSKETRLNSIEHRIITAKGTEKFVEERWEILRDAHGEAVRAIGTCQDITDRISAIEKIKQSEENYRFLFNSSPAAIFIWDLTTLEIMEANETAETLYGYSRQEFLKMSKLDLRLEEEHDNVKTFARQLLNSTTSIIKENWRHRRKDGRTMMMEVTMHRIVYKGRDAVIDMAENVTEKLLMEEELRRSYQDIRQLYTHLQTIREEERAHISRDLHDDLGQLLTSIKMDMVWMGNKLTSMDYSSKVRVDESLQLVDETADTLRRINADLRPEILDDLGLVAALDWYCEEFFRRTGIKCDFYEDGFEPKADNNVIINIFRIFQEALNNVAKHARATHVLVRIRSEFNAIEITISDNGKGFNVNEEKTTRTYGLLGMRERVNAIRGELKIDSAIGHGTTVRVTVPTDQ
jgi:PAS domain S-box-containing protein